MRHLLTVAVSFFAIPLMAGVLSGRVVQILTGDTLAVQTKDHKIHIVRLSGADAPMKRQPYYEGAKAGLRDLAHGKHVQVEWFKLDPVCKRTRLLAKNCPKIGKVFFEGEDLGLKQVSRGLAWQDKPFLDEQSTADRTLYAEAEERARQKKLGLWKDPRPVEPWAFRYSAPDRGVAGKGKGKGKKKAKPH